MYWWRAWACWQTVRLAGRGLKNADSSHGLPNSLESWVTKSGLYFMACLAVVVVMVIVVVVSVAAAAVQRARTATMREMKI